jgi:hypothetical protein
MPEEQTFLLLVKVAPELRADCSDLAAKIRAVEQTYMSKYGDYSRSRSHGALVGPYDFAIHYTGTNESTLFLLTEIYNQLEGKVQTLVMPWVELDEFLAHFGSAGSGRSRSSRR